MITKQDLATATKERKLFVSEGFYNNFLTWADVDDLYESTRGTKYLDYNSFGTMLIEDTEKVLAYYKDAVKNISTFHSGNIYFAMLIVHLINRNNNVINDKDGEDLAEKFYEENPKKIPEALIVKPDGIDGWPLKSFDPTIHFDPEDRFFIQGSGQSLWKIYNDDEEVTDTITLNPGDLAYIPKKLIHSVESLCPRYAISIALSDDPEVMLQ